MTLTIKTAEDNERQLTLTIEIAEDRVQQTMRQKARELGRDIHVPGFRPGKAPYDVIVRRVGADALRAEAIEDLIQPAFEEALNEADIDPYARPSLDDIQSEPLVLTFTIPLTPEVNLGDYRAMRQEVEEVEVTEEALEQALEYVRMRHQVIEPVDRAAEEGDVVTISGKGEFNTPPPAPAAEDAAAEDEADTAGDEQAGDQGELIFEEEQLEVLLDPGTLFPETPFVAEIVGMAIGDQKTFSITFPDEYEMESSYAGREAEFEVTLLEVKRRELPPLDDALAKLEGDFETLDELRTSLREELELQAESSAKEQLIEGMIDALLEDATIIYPPSAVEIQIDDMVEDFQSRLTRTGWQMQDYLQLQGMTEESLRDDFRENAEKQVKRQLVLRQFILDEKLRVEAADIDAIIDERLSRLNNEELKQSMRDYYHSGNGFDLVSSEVLSNKAYERIKAIYAGEAPDLDALEAERAAEADEEE